MSKRCNLRKISTFKVGEYLRISVEEEKREKESNSITNQRKLVDDFVRNQSDMIFIKEYVDDGYTGTNFERPGFQEMLRDAMDGLINCIVVKDLSRFGREHIDTEKYIVRVFRRMGVRFIAICDDYDSLVKGYDMMFSIRNLFNEHYAQDISQKCQAAFKAKQKSGEFVGAFSSYGYRKSVHNKHVLEIDPYAAEVVQRIYTMYIKGAGQLRIANVLNAEGILCPAEYKKQNGENYRNSKKLDKTNYWTYSTIHKILKNEMYTGTMVQGTTKREMNDRPYLLDETEWIKVKDTHPAIIEREIWEKVQKLMRQRTVDMDFDENQSIFAGFLKCADCGRAMSKKSRKDSKGNLYYSFNCGSYTRGGTKVCSSHYVKEEILKEIVLNDLNQIISAMENLREMVEIAKEDSNKAMVAGELYEMQIVRTEETLERVIQLKKKLFEEYALGMISREEYVDYREQYIKEEKTLQNKLIEFKNKQGENDKGDVFEIPWVKRFLEQKQIEKLTREIIVEMVDTIYIYKDHRIKIVYNFSGEYEELMKLRKE